MSASGLGCAVPSVFAGEQVQPTGTAEKLEVVIGADCPQESGHALTFLKHLRRHAPQNWRGLALLLEEASEGAAREDPMEAYACAFDWAAAIPQTNFRGYVGRARASGLDRSRPR